MSEELAPLETTALALRSENIQRQIAHLMDVSIQVSIDVGGTQLRLQRLMMLKAGDVIEVQKPAGEPLDIRLNGKIFARGEVVAVDETAGVRIVDIAKAGVPA